MKQFAHIFFILFFGLTNLFGQIDSINTESLSEFEQSVKIFQDELDLWYSDTATSPLKVEDRIEFTGHPFFDANEKYKIRAMFKRTRKAAPFEMKTTTDRLPVYVEYGKVFFKLEGKLHQLTLYQNVKYSKFEAYKNGLFLPYNDLSNGDDTYAGGRFIDVEIPNGKIMTIDFNQSYNPYCAYNHKYSCPIPPPENNLNVRIEAGVKYHAETWDH